MIKILKHKTWALSLALLGCSQYAFAGSLPITAISESPDTPGALGNLSITSPNINNDNYQGNVSNANDAADFANPNTVAFDVFFDSGDLGGLQGGTFNESQWLVSPTGGITEYLVNITIHNDTGQTMDGYAIELGFGSIFQGTFSPSNALDELDFDQEDFNDPDRTEDSDVFTTVLQGLGSCSTCGSSTSGTDSLWWQDGTIASGETGIIQFSWDIPDFDGANMPSSALNLGGPQYEFSFGQIASFAPPAAVPVPAAIWLFGSGLLGLVGIARRKKLS